MIVGNPCFTEGAKCPGSHHETLTWYRARAYVAVRQLTVGRMNGAWPMPSRAAGNGEPAQPRVIPDRQSGPSCLAWNTEGECPRNPSTVAVHDGS